MSPVIVGIAEIKFVEQPRKLVTYGLGSCVAIALHSGETGMGAMAHIMLPLAYSQEVNETPGKFADSAVEAMVKEMELRGIAPPQIVAKIAGGADMFAGRFQGMSRRIGARNILATRRALDSSGIRLVAQDVGGTAGRTVEFSPGTGLFIVRTLRGEVKSL